MATDGPETGSYDAVKQTKIGEKLPRSGALVGIISKGQGVWRNGRHPLGPGNLRRMTADNPTAAFVGGDLPTPEAIVNAIAAIYGSEGLYNPLVASTVAPRALCLTAIYMNGTSKYLSDSLSAARACMDRSLNRLRKRA